MDELMERIKAVNIFLESISVLYGCGFCWFCRAAGRPHLQHQ